VVTPDGTALVSLWIAGSVMFAFDIFALLHHCVQNHAETLSPYESLPNFDQRGLD